MRGVLIENQNELDLSNKFVNMLSSIETLSNDILTIKNDISVIKKENVELKVYDLEDYADQADEQIYHLEKRMNKLEQYTRRENIEISGISDSVQSESLEDTVLDILDGMNIKIDKNEIEACHRLPKSDGLKKGNVIVRFTNRKIAIDCFKNKKLLKDSQVPNLNQVYIYIAENITPAMKDIINEYKSL